MSLASVGSSNPYAFLQWPFWSNGADSGDASAPSGPLQTLFGAFSGGPASNAAADGSAAPTSDPLFNPAVMSSLLSVQGDQGQTGNSRVQALFAKFDGNGDGQISQSEFENAIGSGADQANVDALFSKLDANGDGSITQNELQSALQQAHRHHHHHAQGASPQGNNLMQKLLSSGSADGASSRSVTNADGSTTTTITYADGTKIDLTTPAASTDAASTPAPSSPNFPSLMQLLQRLISLQAQLAAPTTSLSV